MEQFLGGNLIIRKSFNSTSIAFISYHKIYMTLEVTFKNGAIYKYNGVPENVVSELLSAPSAGKYFQNFVKEAKYSFERLK